MSDPLKVVSGVVSNLSIYAGEEEFIRSAGQQAAGVGVAAGLAASGLAGVAAGTSLAVASGGDSVEFFSCRVGEAPIKGCFSKVSFKDGDELTVVTTSSPQIGSTRVAAARRARDYLIWMTPHCSRGTKAHAAFAWTLVAKLLFVFLFAGGLFVVLMMSMSERQANLAFDWYAFAVVSAMAGIAAPYFAIRFYRQWLPIAREAERIFAALGYPDPSRVDLPRDHKRYCKMHGIKWPYLTDGPWIYHYIDPR